MGFLRQKCNFYSATKLVAFSQNSQKDRDTCQQGLFGNELNSQNFSNILKGLLHGATENVN